MVPVGACIVGTRALAVLACLLFGSAGTSAQTPAETLDQLIANAVTAKDTKSEKRLKNLKEGLSILKPSEFATVTCGKDDNSGFRNDDIEESKDMAGALLTKTLEKYLPTVAAALASAPAAGVVMFLTPTAIAPDAVEVLNQSKDRSKSEVQAAARTMLQGSTLQAFRQLDHVFMAKVIACSF